jgi:WhiB family transcriptional regulator, redox-sensing transcriptional regulator
LTSSGRLAHLIYQHGRCASSRVDPDQWFPVAQDTAKAREEAAEALAVCAACPVRAECLEFALRHSSGFGGHGVWGGMVEADRRALRLTRLEGSTAGQCLAAL